MAQIGTQEGVRTAKKKAKMVRDHEINDVRKIIATDFGRRFFWRYFDFCGIHSCIYQEGAALSWSNGKRLIGVSMLQDVMEANPEAYIQMQLEAKERALNEELAQKNEDAKAEEKEIENG